MFSGLYPVDGDQYPDLRDALDKLRLNDASLVYEPETSTALGFGFRCGFLGLLHMEIIRERLEREFDLSLISTAPNVVYRVVMDSGAEVVVTNPSEFPSGPGGIATSTGVIAAGKIGQVFEPVVRATVLAPSDYIGAIMELCQSRRGVLHRHGVPVSRPGGDQVHDAARRDHLRLLRPAEVAHPRLRLARLRAGRGAGGRPGQGRHPAAGPAGRRVQPDRARRQSPRVRARDDRRG